jgi:hypothetical protein
MCFRVPPARDASVSLGAPADFSSMKEALQFVSLPRLQDESTRGTIFVQASTVFMDFSVASVYYAFANLVFHLT